MDPWLRPSLVVMVPCRVMDGLVVDADNFLHGDDGGNDADCSNFDVSCRDDTGAENDGCCCGVASS